MPFKVSRGLLALIAVAIVGVLIAISLMAGLGGRQTGKPPPVVLGPDTASNTAPKALPAKPEEVRPAAPIEAKKVEYQDEAIKFKAELPSGPANDPVLTYLKEDSQRVLDHFKSSAKAAYDRDKRSKHAAVPWDVKITWSYTAKAGGYVSLAGEESEFNGGAHPNYFYDSHIARASDDHQLKVADMFANPPSAKLAAGICDALRSAKLDKLHAATIFDDPIKCTGEGANAKIEAAVLSLAPSDQPDKFGGVYAFYAPYIIGSHAEGPYKLTVQQSLFADDLKPEFKALFAGRAPETKN